MLLHGSKHLLKLLHLILLLLDLLGHHLHHFLMLLLRLILLSSLYFQALHVQFQLFSFPFLNHIILLTQIRHCVPTTPPCDFSLRLYILYILDFITILTFLC